jgi:hypothetical protein
LIDSIINSSGTPASSMHDIDANKPGGSIKIRVKTYAHTLKRFEEDLTDQAARRSELQKRVEARRHELMETRRLRLQEAGLSDLNQRGLEAAFQAYLEEESTPAGFTEADINPLPPVEAEIILRKGP